MRLSSKTKNWSNWFKSWPKCFGPFCLPTSFVTENIVVSEWTRLFGALISLYFVSFWVKSLMLMICFSIIFKEAHSKWKILLNFHYSLDIFKNCRPCTQILPVCDVNNIKVNKHKYFQEFAIKLQFFGHRKNYFKWKLNRIHQWPFLRDSKKIWTGTDFINVKDFVFIQPS